MFYLNVRTRKGLFAYPNVEKKMFKPGFKKARKVESCCSSPISPTMSMKKKKLSKKY